MNVVSKVTEKKTEDLSNPLLGKHKSDYAIEDSNEKKVHKEEKSELSNRTEFKILQEVNIDSGIFR